MPSLPNSNSCPHYLPSFISSSCLTLAPLVPIQSSSWGFRGSSEPNITRWIIGCASKSTWKCTNSAEKVQQEKQCSRHFKRLQPWLLPNTHVLLPTACCTSPYNSVPSDAYCGLLYTLLNIFPASYSALGSHVTRNDVAGDPEINMGMAHFNSHWIWDSVTKIKAFFSLPTPQIPASILTERDGAECPAPSTATESKDRSPWSHHTAPNHRRYFPGKKWLFQPSLLELESFTTWRHAEPHNTLWKGNKQLQSSAHREEHFLEEGQPPDGQRTGCKPYASSVWTPGRPMNSEAKSLGQQLHT